MALSNRRSGSNCARMALIVALPHSPQLDAAKTCRVSLSRSNGTCGFKETLTTFPLAASGLRAGANAQHVFPAPHDPFRDQKPRRQLDVMIGRSHRDADRPSADADFEGLFRNEFVDFSPGQSVIPADEGRRCEHAHDSVNRAVSEGATGRGQQGSKQPRSQPGYPADDTITNQRMRFPCHPNSSR